MNKQTMVCVATDYELTHECEKYERCDHCPYWVDANNVTMAV